MPRFTKKNWSAPRLRHGVSTKWGWRVLHPKNLKLGAYTDIGAFTLLQAKFGIEIGDCVEIGSHCSIYSVSTIDGKQGKVSIGKGALIGTHSSVMPGVTIGDGAVIGAYSFVTKDIPAGSMAFGVPAKVQKKKCKKKPPAA